MPKSIDFPQQNVDIDVIANVYTTNVSEHLPM